MRTITIVLTAMAWVSNSLSATPVPAYQIENDADLLEAGVAYGFCYMQRQAINTIKSKHVDLASHAELAYRRFQRKIGNACDGITDSLKFHFAKESNAQDADVKWIAFRTLLEKTAEPDIASQNKVLADHAKAKEYVDTIALPKDAAVGKTLLEARRNNQGGPTVAKARTPQEIAKQAFSSTVLLVMEDTDGRPLSLGSGFFVGRGEIATNFHVIKGATRGYAKLIGEAVKYYIEGIIAIDTERDLVVLKVAYNDAPPMPLGNSDAVEIGQSVYAVGNPKGLEGTFSQGIVSGVRQVGTDKLLQITAPISPGSSGGPVLNDRSEVVGVSVATFEGGQNLNFAVPSTYLKTLQSKVGVAKPLAQFASIKVERSLSDNFGGRSTDALIGGQWAWTYNSDIGSYSFSLRNQLRQNVKNVYCLVVFYDDNGNPVDVDILQRQDLIPAGLAKRFTGTVDGSVQSLSHKASFRILDFEIGD